MKPCFLLILFAAICFRSLTSGADTPTETYFPPSEFQGGWRRLESREDIRRRASIDLQKLDELREWLLKSDDRDFAAVVISNGYIVPEVARGNSASTDARHVASVSKAVCATVLALAFVMPRFETGDLEFRCDKDEVMIYGTAKGLVRLAEFCPKVVNRLGEQTTDHIHLEDYELLTTDSLRGALAVFRSQSAINTE